MQLTGVTVDSLAKDRSEFSKLRANVDSQHLLKALAIADTLDAAGLGSMTAASMDLPQWRMAADAARVRPPR